MWSAHRSVTFWKNRPDDGVKWGHWSQALHVCVVADIWPDLPEGVC